MVTAAPAAGTAPSGQVAASDQRLVMAIGAVYIAQGITAYVAG